MKYSKTNDFFSRKTLQEIPGTSPHFADGTQCKPVNIDYGAQPGRDIE